MDKMRQTLSSSAVRTLMIVLAWIFLSSTARSQDYFPIGAWCFTTGGEKYDGENLHSTEKQKLKDLGLNYFIGCLGAKPEQALINYADDPGVTFKITVESTPLDYPAIPTPYSPWEWSTNYDWAVYHDRLQDYHGDLEDPNYPDWASSVDAGYAAIGARYQTRAGSTAPL